MSGVNVSQFAKKIMNKYQFACMSDNEQLWRYSDTKGLWKADAKITIGYEAEKEHASISTHEVKEIINKVSRNVPVKRSIFNNHNGYINITNGMINLKNGKIVPHDPSFYSIYQIPVEYNPDAKCPNIDKFISEIVNEEDKQTIYEMFGFLLFPSYMIHKAFILFGASGHNGKTTFIRLMQEFLGIENCSNIELQDFGKDIFSTASLYGKIANIADDLSSKAMETAGKFKQLTGESPVSAQHKYERRFEFINHAKMIFACNRIPAPPDDADEPFYRRWIIINLDKQFIGNNEDYFLKERITTPEELSGLLNIAIEKHLGLIENHSFSYIKSIEETKRRFLAGSNDSIGRFLVNYIDYQHDCITPKMDIYRAYCDFCDYHDLVSSADNSFFRKFKEYCPNTSSIYTQINGSRHYCIKGIKLKRV